MRMLTQALGGPDISSSLNDMAVPGAEVMVHVHPAKLPVTSGTVRV